MAIPEGTKANPNFYPNLASWLIGTIGFLVVIAGLIALYRLLNLMVKLKEIEIYEQHGITDYLEEKQANKVSWWNRFSRKMTDAVPITKEKEILLNHNYDGIRELDNNLPPWWVYGFYLTILIGVVYMGVYHFSAYGKSSEELYAIEMEQAQEAVERYLARQANKIDESNIMLLEDEKSLSDGKAIFDANCIACHLESGGGSPVSVGPNLTDKYWIHGGGIKNVFKTIKYGVPDKGMISWKTQMRPLDMHKVASYIISLQGTNPPNAKEPQGDLWEGVTRDSTKNTMGLK